MLVEFTVMIAASVTPEELESLKRDVRGQDFCALHGYENQGPEDPVPILTGGYNPVSLRVRERDVDEWREVLP